MIEKPIGCNAELSGAEVGIKLTGMTYFDIVMKARDAMARIFSNFNDKFIFIDSLEGLQEAFSNHYIPVLLQHKLLLEHNPFEFSKSLSTDTTSAYFAHKLGLKKFVKLTNVNGVYRNFGIDLKPQANISVKDLKLLGRTCIDSTLAEYLQELGIECAVLNGYNVNNLKNFIEGKDSEHTLIHH